MRFGRRRAGATPHEQPAPRTRSIVEGDATADSIVERIRRVDWGRHTHAYGAATDVGPELEALTLGDDPTRRAAWNQLWGNVHHQGTVYEATVPALEVVADLAGWEAFPDRREALCLLGALAEGDGGRAAQVARAVRVRAVDLVAGWRDEPLLIRRGLLMLSRSAGIEDDELRGDVLPERHEASWALGTSRQIWAAFGDDRPLDEQEEQRLDAALDALGELESWAFSEE